MLRYNIGILELQFLPRSLLEYRELYLSAQINCGNALKANNYYESEEEEYAETIKELIDEYKEEFASAEWKEKNQLPILNQLHSDI